jgi:hypothetical protein
MIKSSSVIFRQYRALGVVCKGLRNNGCLFAPASISITIVDLSYFSARSMVCSILKAFAIAKFSHQLELKSPLPVFLSCILI